MELDKATRRTLGIGGGAYNRAYKTTLSQEQVQMVRAQEHVTNTKRVSESGAKSITVIMQQVQDGDLDMEVAGILINGIK